jgi:hypothetical protein
MRQQKLPYRAAFIAVLIPNLVSVCFAQTSGLRRFAEVTHLCSSEVTLARNGTASSHAVGVAAWFRTSVEGEARGGKSIDIAVSSRAVGAVGFCL